MLYTYGRKCLLNINLRTFLPCLAAFFFTTLLSCSFGRLTDPSDDIVIVPDDISITEVVTLNKTSLVDQFGESPDWIELHNSGDTGIDLSGYGLSDDRDDPDKWTCGPLRLEAGGYAVICASDSDITTCKPEASEPIDLSIAAISAWADSQFTPAGNSHVRPLLFPDKVFGTVDNKKIVSAHLYLDDNARILNWQVARVTVDLLRTMDYSQSDQIRFIGDIQKGKLLMVRINQLGVNNDNTFGQVFTGTGKVHDTFEIPISHEPRLNRAKITGFTIEATKINDSVNFTITGIELITAASYQHTSFKLSSSGETLLLSNPSGDIVDLHRLEAVPTDFSQGKKPADHSSWIIFDSPTPGAPNKPTGYSGVVQPLTLSSNGAFFNGPVELSLTADRTQIYYTTDGSLPSTLSTLYSAPLQLKATTVVRCRGFSQGMAPSPVETNTYFINDRSELAIISIATQPEILFDPDTGIYTLGPLASDTQPYFGANFWLDKEVPVHIEFFENSGTLGFKGDAGLKIFGNYSRQYPKKSLAIYFKKKYGQGSLTYPLFPDAPTVTTFQSFILRNNGSNFQRAMFNDALAGALIKGLGVDFQKYRPAVVFINGRYWGIHNIREKLNVGYITGNHGYAPEEVDFLKGYGQIEAGDNIHYEDMLYYFSRFDLGQDEHYTYIATQMDIDNFISYMTAELYYANTDWPANNNGWWRPKTPTGKWRWILYDVDGGFGAWGQAYDTNMLTFATDSLGPEWPNPPWSTLMLRKLLKNSAFKRRFINRAATLLALNFETETVIAKIDELAAVIKHEIPRDFTRWETPVTQWESSVNDLKNWARYRPDGMRKTYSDFFGLESSARLTITARGSGTIDVDGISVSTFPFTGFYFKGNPVLLTAADPFKQWSDGMTEKQRLLELSGDTVIEAVFQ
jgi:hypothetical protein